jgi:hypothetical protein
MKRSWKRRNGKIPQATNQDARIRGYLSVVLPLRWPDITRDIVPAVISRSNGKRKSGKRKTLPYSHDRGRLWKITTLISLSL